MTHLNQSQHRINVCMKSVECNQKVETPGRSVECKNYCRSYLIVSYLHEVEAQAL